MGAPLTAWVVEVGSAWSRPGSASAGSGKVEGRPNPNMRRVYADTPATAGTIPGHDGRADPALRRGPPGRARNAESHEPSRHAVRRPRPRTHGPRGVGGGDALCASHDGHGRVGSGGVQGPGPCRTAR